MTWGVRGGSPGHSGRGIKNISFDRLNLQSDDILNKRPRSQQRTFRIRLGSLLIAAEMKCVGLRLPSFWHKRLV